jgi:transposase
MSTSLLYHMYGLRGYRYKRTFYEGGAVVFEVEPVRLCCSSCGSRGVIRRGAQVRSWRATPIGRKRVYLSLAVPRVQCRRCGVVRQVEVGFADARRSYTHAFSRYALELVRLTTIQDAARHLGVSWDVIKELQKEDLRRRFSRPPLKDLRRIAIDEIAVKKGHKYLTIVLDLDRGAVVFVGDGKGTEALEPFWRRLARSRAAIQAVAMDMSPAYIAAVSKNLPKAKIVFDRFHVMKLMNEKLSELRRGLQQEADQLGKKMLKGTRWLLLKNPENLNETRGDRQKLDEALAFNKPLAVAYYMKDLLRLFWELPNKTRAERFLQHWCDYAWESGIKALKNMANTLALHRFGLLAYYDFPISSGPMEGTNNKIKTMKRQAYGYRDMEFFKLKILALHEAKYALVG